MNPIATVSVSYHTWETADMGGDLSCALRISLPERDVILRDPIGAFLAKCAFNALADGPRLARYGVDSASALEEELRGAGGDIASARRLVEKAMFGQTSDAMFGQTSDALAKRASEEIREEKVADGKTVLRRTIEGRTHCWLCIGERVLKTWTE